MDASTSEWARKKGSAGGSNVVKDSRTATRASGESEYQAVTGAEGLQMQPLTESGMWTASTVATLGSELVAWTDALLAPRRNSSDCAEETLVPVSSG